MQKFEELPKKAQNYINGKVAQYMDVYVRRKLVWTPDQMLEDFTQYLEELIKTNVWTEWSDPEDRRICEAADDWILSPAGKQFAITRMRRKYEKDKDIAAKRGTIVDRVRFGKWWESENYFDIGFGLKESNHVSLDEFRQIHFTPWSIEHLDTELLSKYTISLEDAIRQLSTSPIEIMFYEYWLSHYYDNKNNPALIPEVSGFRERFTYYDYKGRIYADYDEIPKPVESHNLKAVNFRFDFLAVSSKKQKAIFIELDGYEFHKTKQQQIIDSIKRNTAARYDMNVLVFPGSRINNNLKACFNEVRIFLES